MQKNHKKNLLAFLAEVILTLTICFGIAFSSYMGLSAKAENYAARVFQREFLFVLLLAGVLIAIETVFYLRNRTRLQELEMRDHRLSAITDAMFQWQVSIDLETMMATSNTLPEPVPYEQFYGMCIQAAVGAQDICALEINLSPEAIQAIDPGSRMEGIRVTVQEPNAVGSVETRVQEIFVMISHLGHKRTATILCNDITENELERNQVMRSVGSQFAAVVVCNVKTRTYELLYAEQEIAERIHGKTYMECVSNIAEDFMMPEYRDPYIHTLEIGLNTKSREAKGREVIVRMKNGKWCSVTTFKSIGFAENHLFIQCISHADEQMQQQENLKAALRDADTANRSKTAFLSRMSHDMRTPMNAIIGLSALTLDEAKNPAAVRDNMTKIRSASDFMLGLVNDILDMARIEDGSVEFHKERYTYREFLMNMRTMFQAQCEEKKIALDIEESKLNPVIIVDKIRMNQIFFNIFSNAVKYTLPGGKITYNTNNLQIHDQVLSVEFIISDTGIGMTPEFQEHLFEPFTQEDESVTPELQGSGLGLSITKQLVDLMGGTIRIESQKNVGTTVTVSLSFELVAADFKETVVMQEKENSDYACLVDKNVLLVEDHPLNAQIARRLLEKKHMRVIHAENGKMAVEKFNASPEFGFDVILMDIRMPEMSGLDATRAIRALARADAAEVPIIAMSANAYCEDVNKSLEAGMNAHLAKPVEPGKLFDTLEEIVLRR
ncbi:hybrid sensor histidine kinase/response regulator [Hespellia stercorisuis]|uniref:Stage 0 sporulation protein A homolog n=1 Tax=Hespellia stercorisuis DSM 15480 TaxID=1121950 RepID=A0A1M6TGZ6_9FIRM|nr:response regulator [Hespellia stercorisuis]SHK56116.1 Signal transduction histidine kinase [Hespellia stercorisuis DSM 15480]